MDALDDPPNVPHCGRSGHSRRSRRCINQPVAQTVPTPTGAPYLGRSFESSPISCDSGALAGVYATAEIYGLAACLPGHSRDHERCEELLITAGSPADLRALAWWFDHYRCCARRMDMYCSAGLGFCCYASGLHRGDRGQLRIPSIAARPPDAPRGYPGFSRRHGPAAGPSKASRYGTGVRR